MVMIRALGQLEVVDDSGSIVDLGGRQPRLMLTVLLAASGRALPVDTLVDAVWGDAPPASAVGTLQSYVSRLRRRLGDQITLRFDDAGYRLEVAPDHVDAWRFERLADAGRAALDAGSPEEARRLLVEADSLWRGPALTDIAGVDIARGVAARLEQRRLAALEDRLAADLQLGRHASVTAELTELVALHPLREKLREQLALALYRSGRQADALRALADAATVLREELGIEPSRPLRDLESQILNHDPSIDFAPAAVRADGNGVEHASPVDAATHTIPAPAAERPSPQAAASQPVSPSNTLVGRDGELAQLVAALDGSAASSTFAVVEGEPGIGKTRLADELRIIAEARGALAVWGRSDEGGAAPALWPWLTILRTVASRVGDVPPALAELLTGQAPMLMGQAGALQYERFEAVADLLASAAAQVPVVVLLDDIQWADATSLELLGFLSGRGDRGVFVVATLRQLEVGRNDVVVDALAAIARRPGSRRLVLRGLGQQATAEMLGADTTRPVSPEVAAAVHLRAEGNPFYAIELARLLDEEGGLGNEVPGNVGDVIRRRLGRLPAPTVELLAAGAVVGRDVPIDLLARTTGVALDECFDRLEPAVIHRLLLEVPENPALLRFSHALVREVLLADLTSLRRARLHLRVADAIEASGADVDDAEILAEHLWQAAPLGVGRRAAEAIEQAAEVAIRRVAYSAAEDLLNRAVQLRRATGSSAEDQESELNTLVRLLEVARALRYFQGAARHEVIDRAKELAERCGRIDTLRDLLWFECAAMQTACRRDRADELTKAYMAITAIDDHPVARASALGQRAVWLWEAGRIAEAAEMLDEAMALLSDAPPAANPLDAESRFVTLCFWQYNHAAKGDRTEEEIFDGFAWMISEAPDRFAIASICGFAATTALSIGAWDQVDRFITIGVEADPGSQFAFWGGQAKMHQGIVAVRNGDHRRGIAMYNQGRDRYMGIGGRSGIPTFGASMAMVLAMNGHLEEALPIMQAARTDLHTHRELWNEATVIIAEGVIADTSGDPSLAAERFAEAAAVATEQGALAVARRAEAMAADLKGVDRA